MKFLGQNYLMSTPVAIYGAVLILTMVSFVLYSFAKRIYLSLSASSLWSSRIRPFLLRHVIYARLYWRFLVFGSTPRSHLILTLLYFTGTGICNIVRVHSIEDAGKRAAQLSLLNLIPMFFGGNYEFGARLLGLSLRSYAFLHRSFALVVLIEAIVHFIIIAQTRVVSWKDDIQFYGLLTASLTLALVVLPIVKKRVYEAFLVTHLGCATTMVYALWRHTRATEGKLWLFPLAYTCMFAFTGALQLIRIIYRNMVLGKTQVRLNLQPHVGDVALITLSLPRPWVVRAGQRINLGVPHVGIFYIFQTHPFAISWWENNLEGQAVSISILIRPRSGFTKRIFDRVEPNRETRAWIDGPFGPSSVNWSLTGAVSDYGHIFMVTTGIGIAAQLSYIKELLDGHDKAQVSTQRVSLVWQLENVGDWESVRDLLQVLVRQDNGYMLRVSVYDPIHTESETEVQNIGKNGLIHVHRGYVNWEEQLDRETGDQIGNLLVLVSAQSQVRYQVRNLVRARVKKGVELFETEFQPWKKAGGLKAFLKP